MRRLLAGGHVHASELDYELDAWHLGVIGRGEGVALAIRGLAAALDCRLLCVSHEGKGVWAWLGAQRKRSAGEIEPLLSSGSATRVSLAVGESARGVAGCRLTHEQAQDALLMSLRRPQVLTRYADVALVAPWLRDEERARWLVETYLSPLDQRGCSGTTLRQTLRAYFAAGRNSSAAARALHASRRTFRNRMAVIEEALGALLDGRQAELELALRLDELLGPRTTDDLHA